MRRDSSVSHDGRDGRRRERVGRCPRIQRVPRRLHERVGRARCDARKPHVQQQRPRVAGARHDGGVYIGRRVHDGDARLGRGECARQREERTRSVVRARVQCPQVVRRRQGRGVLDGRGRRGHRVE